MSAVQNSGGFVISLDFELHWGVRDHRSVDEYRPNLLGVRQALPAMLELFERNANAEIGRGAIIYTAAIVEHDCRIGDFAHLSPKAAIGGHVQVGEFSWLGIGSAVIPNIRTGAYSIIGAGATVVRDVDDWVVAAGTPAHTLRELARRI